MNLLNFRHHQYTRAGSGHDVPMWLKVSFTALAVVVFVAYWDYYGPENYLWFSDIALFALVPALWLGNRLIASTMAIAVLIPEIVWTLDFITLSYFSVLANYMFEAERALHIRVLSGKFHLALPPVLIYMLYKFGYGRRGFALQCLVALIVLPVTYLVSDPEANINWAFGSGEAQDMINPWLYLLLLWFAMVVIIYLPIGYANAS
ncbi:membrane-associated protein [Aliidiomarina maris]|uniref:Membrane-associated protein n=1 Tax=Aliidiomarina maris TaxID=531312 RepID=A0A327WMH9_9GAMM|nr:membrane-associated protein [Aliidiomarina maris]MCL5049188.1 membrane-associated protein [Bacillota bacterium]RAJ92891.1 hypothetical protein B0I24_1282 [Aliidiomarina maris]RUO18097.1 membrane-associated protein [Aliidiomarina maris]